MKSDPAHGADRRVKLTALIAGEAPIASFTISDIVIATPWRIAVAGQIACLGFAVEIGVVAAIIRLI